MITDRSSGANPTGAVSTSPFNILLVDNNLTNLMLAGRILKKAFPKAVITTAKDGTEFLEKLKAGNRYDFVVLDDLMDTLNGSIAILVWRMLELKNLKNKSEKELAEFDELKDRLEIFKTDLEKEVNDKEQLSAKDILLKTVLLELIQLSADLEVSFKKSQDEPSTSEDKKPRLRVLAWSDTAKNHPKGYIGADARLGKPLDIKYFYESEVLDLIKEAEKNCIAAAVEITASEPDSAARLPSPEVSKSVANVGLFKKGPEESEEEKIREVKEIKGETGVQKKPKD